MPIRERYTLVCDEVRQEVTGKFLIIGVYTGGIVVPQIPFMLPSLTFFSSLESDRPGVWNVRLRIQHLETGRILAQGMGAITFPRPGPGVNALRFPNVGFIAPGTYNLVIEIDGQPDPIIVPFDVALNVQPPQPFPQGR